MFSAYLGLSSIPARRLGTWIILLLALTAAPVDGRSQTQPKITFNPKAQVEIEKSATTVMKDGFPPTPTSKLPAPLPEGIGCFHFEGKVWKTVECATPEYMKAHHLPRPMPINSIQSTPHTAGPNLIRSTNDVTSPFVWGSITIFPATDPTLSTEFNTPVAGSRDPPVPNAFSVQANTDFFPCTLCTTDSPFPGTRPGDRGWVQFTYQNLRSGSVVATSVCVWSINVDHGDYAPGCVYPSERIHTVLPLTGPGAPAGQAEVMGFIRCPTSGTPTNCTLYTLAYLPWYPGHEWWLASAPDVMGLHGHWTNLSGGIYGAGDQTMAAFSHATLHHQIQVYSCDRTDPRSPIPLTCPTAPGWLGRFRGLTASGAGSFPSGESNNLVNQSPTLSCNGYGCSMTFDSIAP